MFIAILFLTAQTGGKKNLNVYQQESGQTDYPYDGIQPSNKNEWTTGAHNMDESQKHPEGKKLDTKEYILYDCIIWGFWTDKTSLYWKIITVVAPGLGTKVLCEGTWMYFL